MTCRPNFASQVTVDSIDAVELVGFGQSHEENQKHEPWIIEKLGLLRIVCLSLST